MMFYDTIPTYSEVKEKLYNFLDTNVRFKRNISELEYKELLEIKKSLEKARISKQISFIYNDVAFFHISIEVDTIDQLRKKEYYLKQR